MEYRVRVNLLSSVLALSLVVGVSIVTSVIVASRAYTSHGRETAKQGRLLSTKGSARQRVRSDTADWRITVQGEAPDLPASYERIEAGEGKLRELLKSAGFAEAEIAAGAIQTQALTRNEPQTNEQKTCGYRLSRVYTVSSGAVDRVADAAGRVTELIKDGVLVSSEPPRFTYSKLPDLRVSLLGEASKDARTRADEIAGNTGARVGEVRSARMGVMQVVRPNATDVSDYGAYDTSTIEKDVCAVVTVEFVMQGK